MERVSVNLELPQWLWELTEGKDIFLPEIEDRMKFTIELSSLNVKYRTGGPFGAAVFESETGQLAGAGVNMVVTGGSSVFHAEMTAIMFAQKNTRKFELSNGGNSYDLFASTEPCAMCFGAMPWSGIKRLFCAAKGEDAENIGFDEGPKLPDWEEHLRKRGIEVYTSILRNEAAAVLNAYKNNGGVIYNSDFSLK